MKKDIAKELEEFALVIRDRYSNKQRAGNFNNETFEWQK